MEVVEAVVAQHSVRIPQRLARDDIGPLTSLHVKPADTTAPAFVIEKIQSVGEECAGKLGEQLQHDVSFPAAAMPSLTLWDRLTEVVGLAFEIRELLQVAVAPYGLEGEVLRRRLAAAL